MTPPIIGLTLNYRDAQRTRRCVESLLADGAAQVFVWDNSADDGSTAATLRQAFAHEPRVHIALSRENLGFAAGVNRGISCIRTHHPCAWVCLLNNDATILPGGLAALGDALNAHPDAILAYPDIDHNGRVLGTIWYQRWLALITFKPLPGSFPYPSGCALLFAPERWPEPLLDEDFFMYGEDAYLGWVHRGSKRLLYVPGAWVWHEGSASSGMGSTFYEGRLVAGHWLLAGKLASNRFDFSFLCVGRIFAMGLRAAVRSWRFRSVIPIKTYLSILVYPRKKEGHVE
jgi:N-acetylglucosaminyl-diphospho-decaprenol L-rhamnosyltransferase